MNDLSSLLRLDGHGLFVWGAWLPCVVLLVAEAVAVRARLRRARAEAARRIAEGEE
ncbi:heme exporter protein CcmD [Ideonella sp. YS5]|uniref:heme exporter protein CcmD n=1 Tax=Ideonella sp. YS5 TaxID=3453714 RepID=UPI003EEEB4F7